MKKTAKTRRDNRAIQRNIDWLRYKTRYLKNRAFYLLKNRMQREIFMPTSSCKTFSANRYLKRIGINQEVVKKVCNRFKNRK